VVAVASCSLKSRCSDVTDSAQLFVVVLLLSLLLLLLLLLVVVVLFLLLLIVCCFVVAVLLCCCHVVVVVGCNWLLPCCCFVSCCWSLYCAYCCKYRQGQLGLGTFSIEKSPKIVRALSGQKLVKLNCGWRHTVFLSGTNLCISSW